MIIRLELPGDRDGIHEVNEKAFGQPQEARLVDKLRDRCSGLLSLVAVENDKIIGHILFSPVEIESPLGGFKGMGLAPMAVLPDMQRRGFGTALVRAGIDRLRQAGCSFIIVLGHPEYYPRFGFEPASFYGIKPQWEGVPHEAFMVLWLDTTLKGRVSGVARYRDEFNDVI